MKRKKDDDPHQSSLDSFANVELPSMPDLDQLAKADKMLKENQSSKETEKNNSLNTFDMPSMSKTRKKNDVPSKLIFHNLGNKYPDPPITSNDTGLVVHRAVLNDITGISTLLNWLADGHASIVEMGRLIKRDTEFSAALDELHTFIEGDLGGQIIQITDTRLMLLPPGCRGLKGVEMEAFAAGAEELGRRRL
jgi:SepF-like predicted cell division protein (DUF552 family)|tara:strand:+ start:298 stop:876 length:579 start_codon:yes stop_codon:yes gene_type:complete